MLEFRLNGRSFLLNEKTSVKIKWASPACFHDKLIGDVGLGIELPDNRHNRAMLGNPERFDKYSSGSDKKFPGFEIVYGGVLLLGGTLVVKEGMSGWLQSEYGVLREAQKEKKITEMDWPTAQTFSNKEYYSDDVDDYTTTIIHNPGFWDGIGKEITIKTPFTDENGFTQEREETRSQMSEHHLNNYAWWVNNHALPAINAGLVISPYLFLRYVIKESLRLNKWFIGRNDMIGGIYGLNLWANLAIYNNFNIVDLTPLTTIVNEWRWDDRTHQKIHITFNMIYGYGWTVKQFAYSNLLPRVKFHDFILGLQNYLNFIFRFRSDMRVDIIDRNAILSGAVTDLDQWHTGIWKPGERRDVTLKFISEYDKDDGEFSEFEDLSDRRADFKASVETYDDLKALPTENLKIGELRLVRQENKIYEYKWYAEMLEDFNYQEFHQDALDWQFVSCGPQPYLYGDSEEIEEIKTSVGTLQQTHGEWGLPIGRVNQKGNLASTPSVYNDFSLRMINGNSFLWGEGLYWDGTYGLFKTRWENWARFWKNRLEVTAEFDLPLNMISYLIDNITGKFRTREGEFIIEEMECEFGMNKIGKTTIKGYKV